MVTDSTSSLSPSACREAGISLIPLRVVIDGVSRPEVTSEEDSDAGAEPAMIGVTPGQVARALRQGRRVTTSRPRPEAFAATYARLADTGHSAVVSVHLSRAMSGTVDAARLAATQAPIPVTVLDAGCLAMAMGFAVLAGAAAAADGETSEQIARRVRRRADAATTYFCVASLEHLRRGGRIGAAAAALGSALAVKPLLTVEGGRIRPHERVRTASRARARLLELGLTALARTGGTHPSVDVAVHHLDDPAGAEALAAHFADVSIAGTVISAELSAVLAVHTGPGTLGLVISPRT
jgi:DegV family protein with EDD domain